MVFRIADTRLYHPRFIGFIIQMCIRDRGEIPQDLPALFQADVCHLAGETLRLRPCLLYTSTVPQRQGAGHRLLSRQRGKSTKGQYQSHCGRTVYLSLIHI